MLKELRIENLALISEMHLAFDSRYAVFTGETGTGKSIVLQALGLLSGNRASSSLVRSGAAEAVVEALFEVADVPQLHEILAGMGIDADDELVIRRTISAEGKSRFLVNGSLCTAKQVSAAAEYLVSVASQHEHQQLLQARFHLDFIDTVGGLWNDRLRFRKIFTDWQECSQRLTNMLKDQRDTEQRLDFLRYQLDEILAADLKEGEDELLEAEKRRLQSSEELKKLGARNVMAFEQQLLDILGNMRRDLEKMAELDPSLAELYERFAGQSFLMEEAGSELARYVDDVVDDQERLDQVTERIDLIARLKRKYGPSIPEVLNQAHSMQKELAAIESGDDAREKLEQKRAALQKDCLEMAKRLSVARQRVAASIEEALLTELHNLGFADARFTIQLEQKGADPEMQHLTQHGLDRAEFLFSANTGEQPKPLVKVASGGELSRIMLALRSILAQKDLVKTVIFDEVDAGIGGKAAEAVARKIRELAAHHQVLCITHLPQLAACAQEHYSVEKGVQNGRTHTTISKLSSSQRVDELARMLDGNSVTPQTLAFASELIARNRLPEQNQP